MQLTQKPLQKNKKLKKTQTVKYSFTFIGIMLIGDEKYLFKGVFCHFKGFVFLNNQTLSGQDIRIQTQPLG